MYLVELWGLFFIFFLSVRFNRICKFLKGLFCLGFIVIIVVEVIMVLVWFMFFGSNVFFILGFFGWWLICLFLVGDRVIIL